eukprot:6641816-Pyramimonas_sp.AAC.1
MPRRLAPVQETASGQAGGCEHCCSLENQRARFGAIVSAANTFAQGLSASRRGQSGRRHRPPRTIRAEQDRGLGR